MPQKQAKAKVAPKQAGKGANQKPPVEKKAAKKKPDVALIVIIVCLIIIAVPFGVLAFILISDSMKTGTPIVGDRFKNDLDPAITDEEITSINSRIQEIQGVEEVDSVIKTATLRIYVDMEDSRNAEQLTAAAQEIYQAVTAVLDPSLYFSQHNNQKMYDLEIHAYNMSEDPGTGNFAYVIANKNSSMEEMQVQTVSEPKDAELAQQLRDQQTAQNNAANAPEPEEQTVGGMEEEQQQEEPQEEPEE